MKPRLSIRQAAARYAYLDAARFKRRLTAAERLELDRLDRDRALRLTRLPGQIAAAQAKLLRLNAEYAVLADPAAHARPSCSGEIHGRQGSVIIDEFPDFSRPGAPALN